jgi:hypothetical protein
VRLLKLISPAGPSPFLFLTFDLLPSFSIRGSNFRFGPFWTQAEVFEFFDGLGIWPIGS